MHTIVDNRTNSNYNVMLNQGVANSETLKNLLDRQKQSYPSSIIENKQLGQILIENGIISEAQLQQALCIQSLDNKVPLGSILLNLQFISPKNLYVHIATQMGMPFINLDSFDIEPEVAKKIPEDIARKYSIAPLFVYHNRLAVAMSNPCDSEAFNMLSFISKYRIDVSIATPASIEQKISELYEKTLPARSEIDFEFELSLHQDTKKQVDTIVETLEAERLSQEKPFVRLVNSFIIDAINKGASDIHIHPQDDGVEFLLRLDGVMVKTSYFNKSLLPAIVSRIKVISGMNIAERRLPQDGQARVTYQGQIIDLRVSVIPLITGESVVIRIFNPKTGIKQLSELGFNNHDEQKIRSALESGNGMILVTGPTGSGKSTTLYSSINEIRSQNLNIITVEDPVEYHLTGIEQIQANPSINYSFSKALKSILRHDPDVIMIGEIRDQETAQIAIESALTGHLVLSTLHSNNTAATITRLLDMGIEPYAISSTVQAILSQRLVRCNCPHCTQPGEINSETRHAFGLSEHEVFYQGVGCQHCNHTGYQGRIAVYELLIMSHEIRTAILQGLSIQSIKEIAREQGMVTLTQTALKAAREGKTSIAEVYRISKLD